MRVTYRQVLMGLVTIGLLAGCSTKEVEYDGASSITNKVDQNVEATDGKLDQIGGNEQSVENANDTNNMESNKDYLSKGVHSVSSDIGGNTITLNSVHFGFDNFTLTNHMRDIATDNASTIGEVVNSYNGLKIKLEGNCDEWGTDEYNYALGLKRAKSTKDALIADGISKDRISLVSFGESNPVCNDKNVDCWKMNRRVDYRLLP